MARRILFFAGAFALLLMMAWLLSKGSFPETLVESRVSPPDPMPLCPWREPEADMQALFPGATRYEAETRILSGLRLELQTKLGRLPSGDENALHLFRIYRDQILLGTVTIRRVKGEFGAIELVLAIGTDRQVRGWRVQRSREPAPIIEALLDPAWQRSFEGKGADSHWQLGLDIPTVVPAALGSAAAVVDGTRSLLILVAAADHAPLPSGATPVHTHL
jgi:hypothetical protein